MTGIRALLDALNPEDADESAHLDAMRVLARSPDATSRHHYDPGHFTASAFVLDPTGSELLLIHHGKLDRWLQPGGHVDPEDPDLIAAARREVAEETGITDASLEGPVPFDVDVHVIPARVEQPEHRHYDVRFLFRAPSRAFRAGSDAKDARWVPLENVNAVESDASVMRAVGKLLSARGSA